MDQRLLYDSVCLKASRLTTIAYSTSFSVGIRCLAAEMRGPIYSIYGFVRLADEIVDTFHEHDQQSLLQRFRQDTLTAIEEKISLNPILHSFQATVNRYHIPLDLIEAFLESMETDLCTAQHDLASLSKYVLGSAEVVGLMCLHIFLENDLKQIEALAPFAMKLGSALQKVNFLRDMNADVNGLGRKYFPEMSSGKLSVADKKKIEEGIQSEFDAAYEGIRQLPRSSRFGVYVAYLYYRVLFRKIRQTPAELVLQRRIRVPNPTKVSLLCYSYIRHQLNLI